MAKKQRGYHPQKQTKPKVPNSVKQKVAQRVKELVDSTLKPQYVKPPPGEPQFNYLVDIRGDGIEDSQLTTPELANGEKWEGVVSLVPRSLGDDQKVEFWLYKAGEAEPCLEEPLYIYFDVIKTPS